MHYKQKIKQRNSVSAERYRRQEERFSATDAVKLQRKVVKLKVVRATWNWSLFCRAVPLVEARNPLVSRAQHEPSTHNHPDQPTNESTHRHQPLHTTTQRSIPHSESHNSLSGSASQSASDLPTLRVRFPLFPPAVSSSSFTESRGRAAWLSFTRRKGRTSR